MSISPASGDQEVMPENLTLNFDQPIPRELFDEMSAGLSIGGTCAAPVNIEWVGYGNSLKTAMSVQLQTAGCQIGKTFILSVNSSKIPFASVTYTYKPAAIPAMKWDPVQSGTVYMKILNSNLSVEKDDLDSNDVFGTAAAFANRAVSSGKWYFEVRVDSIYNSNRQRIGIASVEGRLPHGPSSASYSYGIDFDGTLSVNAYDLYTNNPMGSAVKAGDVVGVAMNLDDNKVRFSLNGVVQGESAIAGGQKYSPMFFASKNSNALITANFGARKTRYEVPAGYKTFDALDTSLTDQAVGWNKTGYPNSKVTFSADGYTATKDDGTAAIAASAYGALNMDAERLYYEMTVSKIIAGEGLRFGIASTTGREVNTNGGATAKASYDYDGRGGTSVHANNGYTYHAVSGAPKQKVNDVIGVAFDRIAGTVTYYVNGAKVTSVPIDKALSYSPHFHGSKNNNGTVQLNVGQTPFKYAPPARSRALISKSTNF